jgi:hypothetical protein
MQFGQRQGNPELRAIVIEASRALALLDTQRLEELMLSCLALNRMVSAEDTDINVRRAGARQAGEAKTDMAVFERVLEATRANISVLNRLREMRAGKLEYTVHTAAAEWSGAAQAESDDGNH